MFGWDRKAAQRKLDNLQERCEKLEREMHALQLDWENTYDKVRSMMGRIAKRAEALHHNAEARGELFPGGDEPDGANGAAKGSTPTGRQLTPRQIQIQQEVLRRRAGVS